MGWLGELHIYYLGLLRSSIGDHACSPCSLGVNDGSFEIRLLLRNAFNNIAYKVAICRMNSTNSNITNIQ